MMLHLLTLTWQRADLLRDLLQSLEPALDGINYQYHIKDNGSTDNTEEVVKSFSRLKINYIKYPNNNQNFSQGMNYLFDQANSHPDDLILLLNNDVKFRDNSSLRKMITLMKKTEVGIVGAKLLNQEGKINHAGTVFESRNQLPRHFRQGELDSKQASKNRCFQAVTAAVMLTTADIFKKAGKMNEKYRWMFDDVDFNMRVGVNLKKKIVYCGETNIIHHESATLKQNPVNKLFFNYNINLFKQDWAGKYLIDEEFYLKNEKYNLY